MGMRMRMAAVLGLVLAAAPGGAADPTTSGRPVAELVRQLKTGAWGERIAAADALGRLGPAAAEAAPALAEALEHPAMLGPTVDALARIGPEPVAALGTKPFGLASLSSRYDGLRLALVRMGPSAVPALTRTLAERDPSRQCFAAECLADLGPRAVDAVPALARVVAERHFALAVSFEQRPTGLRRVPVLGPLLPAEFDWPVVAVDDPPQLIQGLPRAEAAQALGAIGPAALSAVDDILRDGGWSRVRGMTLLEETYRDYLRTATPSPVAGEPVDESKRPLLSPLTRGLLHARMLMLLPEAMRPDPAARAMAVHAIGRMARGRPVPEDAVRRLRDALDDPDEDVRLAAVANLHNLGPAAGPAAPALVRVLARGGPLVTRSEDSALSLYLRMSALRALLAAGPEGERAVIRQGLPLLVRLLEEGDVGAAEALNELGPRAAPAVPALARAFVRECTSGKDMSCQVRPSDALASVGPAAVPVLRRLLHHPQTVVRKPALEVLTRIETRPAEGIPELLTLLRDPVAEIRAGAAEFLARTTRRPETVPALMPLLRDPDVGVRHAAIHALRDLGPGARPAVPELRRLLGGADTELAAGAAAALVAAGADPAEPLDRLCALLESEPEGSAQLELEQLGPRARPALFRLERLTHQPERKVRLAAAFVLSGLGSRGARLASASLAPLLADPALEQTKRDEILRRLCDTAPMAPEAVHQLAAQLATGETHGQPECVLAAFVRIGPEGRAAGPALGKLLGDGRNGPRAALALARVDQAAPDLVPYLMGLMRHPQDYQRRAAAVGLGAVGPRAAAAVPQLRALARDGNLHTLTAATWAVLRITGDERTWGSALTEAVRRCPTSAGDLCDMRPVPRPVVRGLALTLGDADPAARNTAARLLSKLGPAARPAVPDLIRLVRGDGRHRPGEPCPQDRLGAVEALGRLGAAARPALPALWLLAERHPDAVPTVEAAVARITAPPDDDP